jgi:hypothetical protein
MKIWGKYKKYAIEEIDNCEKKDVDYMLREYRLAWPNWIIWAGRKYPIPED